MRKILLILFLFVLSFVTQAQNINRFEYFFDTDPGYGAGTIVNVTPATTITDFNIPVETSALSNGFHKLYIRAQNATNQWTHTHLRSLYIVPFAASTNITQIEYYIDTDPGLGLGTQVSFTAAPTITNLAIDISAVPLTSGFHKLYVRSKSSDGQWTHTHLRSFYVVPFTASTNIAQIEYFIDTDPGIGLATQVSFTAAPTITNLAIDISAVPLSTGFHKLYVRSKSSDGQWTQTHLRSFYVANVGVAQNLVKFEYFFDADPGFDNGTAAAITPAVPSVTNQDILADATGLTIGSHTIYVRAKDSGGEWTQVSTGNFSVVAALPPTITSFTPTSGAPGTTIIITGTNFGTTPASNVVVFGATKAIVTAATSTQLTATLPTGATYSPIMVLNTSTSLLAYSRDNFTPTFTPSKTDITIADFDPKVDFTAGTSPFSTAIGDLDGDGKSDLAATNYGTNTLSIFRNTGSSGTISYAPKVDFTTGSLPYSVAIGDLDGDGKADLAVNNYASSTVSVFHNTSSIGTISFDPKVDFGTGVLPYAVAINDFDGDGKADIVTSNDNNSVSILRNTGSPGSISYAAKVDFTTPTAPFFVSIADLDGDGKVDLVTPNNTSTSISVFRNTSTPGIISVAAKVDFTTGINPTSVAIGDMDLDGKADLAVTNYSSSTVSVFRNTSNSGTISYAAKVDFATAGNPFSVSIGDLNGDSKADMAVAQGNSTLAILRNTSTGVGNIGYAAKIDLTTGASPRSISIGDLDGDGKSDLAVANSGIASISVIRNNSILAPVITGFTPSSGPAGTTVTITGTNFTGTTTVTFGGTVATSFTVVSPTSITASTGTGTSGKITITTPAGTAISSTDFTFTTPDLIIISTQPTSGAVCEGSTAALTVAATGTTNIIYQWQKFNGTTFVDLTNTGGISGATSATLSINTTGNIGSGDYRCKVSGDLTQDKFSNVATLTVNPLPTEPTITGTSSCVAAALTLNASGGSNGQYRWYDVATGGTSIAGQVNSSYVTPVISATASYYVSVNNGTCESPRVEVKATILTVPTAPSITAGSSCGPGTVTLQAAGGTNGQYRWYDVATGGTALTGETNSSFITPALTSTTTYYVSINNGSCESARTAVTASVFAAPTKPTITASEPVTAGVIQLCQKSITLTAPAGFTYTWSNGQTTQSISVVQPGNFSVILKDTNNCSSASSDVLQVILNTACTNNPPAINTTSLITTIGGFVSIDLTSYISDPDNNLDLTSIQVVGNKTQRGGKTTLTGFKLDIDYTGINFSGSDQVAIRICDLLNACVEKEFAIEVIGDITVYNGISPNGDGINDTWLIKYIDLLPDTQNNQVTIYNRWGDVVWEASKYNNSSVVFTGLSKNGSELSTGSYFYKITLKDRTGPLPAILTGYISLKR